MILDRIRECVGRDLEGSLVNLIQSSEVLSYKDTDIVSEGGQRFPQCAELYILGSQTSKFESLSDNFKRLGLELNSATFLQKTGLSAACFYVLYNQGGYLYGCNLDFESSEFGAVYYLTVDGDDESFEAWKVSSTFKTFIDQLEKDPTREKDYRDDLGLYQLRVLNANKLSKRCISSRLANFETVDVSGLLALLLVKIYPNNFQFVDCLPFYSLGALVPDEVVQKEGLKMISKWSNSYMKDLEKAIAIQKKLGMNSYSDLETKLKIGYEDPFNEIAAVHLGVG